MLVNAFKWKHFVGEIILLDVRWYLKYSFSFQNLKEMMAKREVIIYHTTIMEWYINILLKWKRRYVDTWPTNNFWRMYETYIRIKGKWKYLYRVVDSTGNTIDFMLMQKETKKLQRNFLRKLWVQSTIEFQR